MSLCLEAIVLVTYSLFRKAYYTCIKIIVSEFDQEIPQSQTADKQMAPRGRATQNSRERQA